MKRYITINSRDLDEALLITHHAPYIPNEDDAYWHVIEQLREKYISYADQYANSHKEIKLSGVHTSFYLEKNKWKHVKHQ